MKDFDSAKQRLAPSLDPAQRRRLARRNAGLALAAAAAGRVVAVAGSSEAAELASSAGAEVIREAEPHGQNAAASRAVEYALDQGAAEVLLLSSDLPLVSRALVAQMIDRGRQLSAPVVLAAPAAGRGGTNALYLRPPGAIGLHFGDDSLAKFERDAADRAVTFALFEVPELALDLDEPADLARLPGATAAS